MFIAERLLISLAAGGFHALKWFIHEFLLLAVRPPAGSRLTSLCRVTGCLVIVLSLRLELRAGLLASTMAALIQLGVAGLTAILIGNVAKEFAFDLCARFIVWSGRAFLRTGLFMNGRSFWEIQFRDGTWMRGETASTGTSCEWTEPDGRCNRFEVRTIARGQRAPLRSGVRGRFLHTATTHRAIPYLRVSRVGSAISCATTSRGVCRPSSGDPLRHRGDLAFERCGRGPSWRNEQPWGTTWHGRRPSMARPPRAACHTSARTPGRSSTSGTCSSISSTCRRTGLAGGRKPRSVTRGAYRCASEGGVWFPDLRTSGTILGAGVMVRF